jgi:hypothetical protein
MHQHSEFLKRTCLGAAGGFIGTVAIQAFMGARTKWLPESAPPLRQHPGEFLVEQAEEALPAGARRHIPEAAESAVAQGLGVGYGMAFGALYAALRRQPGNALLGGAVLGLGCWAAGYLGWLPATGLTPPIWKQSAAQVLGPVVDHLAYGVVTAAAYDWLCGQFNPAVPVEVELGTEKAMAGVG